MSYILAKQTQQPKTVNTLHLHTGQYSNFCFIQKLITPRHQPCSMSVRKVLTVSPKKNEPFYLKEKILKLF